MPIYSASDHGFSIEGQIPASEKWVVWETRAYATKQRPITATVHGPYLDKEAARAEMIRMSRASARNDIGPRGF